jgi:hypothetical protein
MIPDDPDDLHILAGEYVLGVLDEPDASEVADHHSPCPCCGGRIIVVDIFQRGGAPRGPPSHEAAVRATMP